jgi:hypothetical protein
MVRRWKSASEFLGAVAAAFALEGLLWDSSFSIKTRILDILVVKLLAFFSYSWLFCVC